MMRRIAISLVIVITASCKKEKPAAAAPPPVYPVVTASVQDVNTHYIMPAKIAGINNIQVRPKISGFVKEVKVDEGDMVSKGQILFKLETNVQDQDASAAHAQIAAAEASIETARANVNAAEVEVEKLIPLVEKNIISQVQLETARANLLKAKGQLSQAIATHESAKATYQSLNENINFSNVISPIDGVVGKINQREGALAGPQMNPPLTTISNDSEVFAYFSINEKQFIYFFQNFPGANLEEKIQLVPPVQLELANETLYDETGVLEASTGEIDPMTGTIQFRVRFDNENGMLKNGGTGKVLIPRTYKKALVIPESASFDQQGITYTYVVRADTAFATPIKIKDRLDNLIIVEEGLSEGTEVVAKGVNKLRSGQVIQPEPVSLKSLQEIPAVK